MKEIYKPAILNYQHKSLAEERWAQMSPAEQMLNIGSEVSRASRCKSKGNQEMCTKEFTRLYEVLCDFFLGDNQFHSDSESLQRYFDVFARRG